METESENSNFKIGQNDHISSNPYIESTVLSDNFSTYDNAKSFNLLSFVDIIISHNTSSCSSLHVCQCNVNDINTAPIFWLQGLAASCIYNSGTAIYILVQT